MANLNEVATWEEGIYQLEPVDLVEGGPDGTSNIQAKQLANRTKFLKETFEDPHGPNLIVSGVLTAGTFQPADPARPPIMVHCSRAVFGEPGVAILTSNYALASAAEDDVYHLVGYIQLPLTSGQILQRLELHTGGDEGMVRVTIIELAGLGSLVLNTLESGPASGAEWDDIDYTVNDDVIVLAMLELQNDMSTEGITARHLKLYVDQPAL